MRLWRASLLVLAAIALPLACAGKKRAPPLAAEGPPTTGQAGADSGLMLGDVNQPPTGACGSESIPAISDPPNIEFILDRSGSMGEDLIPGSGISKYANAYRALKKVLMAVGHRVNYGITIYPVPSDDPNADACRPPLELSKVQPGDPPSYARAGEVGEHLASILQRLSIAGVGGNTPTADALTQALDSLTKLEGTTYVVLITDGAPNCGHDLMCDRSACIPNIEGTPAYGLDCSKPVNCCQPSDQFPTANESCVDADASVAAVKALADAGIKTFVVGMPGSEPYERLLSDMAEAGGTARTGDTEYYPVTDADALAESLIGIAASVAISCDVPLDYEPPDPDFVNVYFDGVLVEYDPEAGWEWTADGQVAIRGAACEQLMAGDVLEVQVLAGCKTVVK
jgi:hypothetical protein